MSNVKVKREEEERRANRAREDLELSQLEPCTARGQQDFGEKKGTLKAG